MKAVSSNDRARTIRKQPRFVPAFFLIITLFILSFAERAAAKSFLWEVKSPTTTVFLLGSIHFAKSDMYPLASVIEESFAKSSNLVLELNPLNVGALQIQQELLAKGVYTGDRTLKDDLSPEVFGMLEAHLEESDYLIPKAVLMQMKPGVLAMMLSALEYMKLGYSPEQGIDIYFANKAGEMKPILELESVQEQLDMIFNMPNPELLLKYTIMDLSKTGEQISELVEFWKAGNADSINNLMIGKYLEEYPELLSVMEEILFKRNRNMTHKIQKYLSSDKTYFVVVGAGHLVGDKGIVKLLEEAGYEVRQL
jgi:uncharacterized protein YbaP (TraB family)